MSLLSSKSFHGQGKTKKVGTTCDSTNNKNKMFLKTHIIFKKSFHGSHCTLSKPQILTVAHKVPHNLVTATSLTFPSTFPLTLCTPWWSPGPLYFLSHYLECSSSRQLHGSIPHLLRSLCILYLLRGPSLTSLSKTRIPHHPFSSWINFSL